MPTKTDSFRVVLSRFARRVVRPACIAIVGVILFSEGAASAQVFVQKTSDVGFAAAGNTNGVAVADYDGDGDLDVYFVSHKLHDPAKPSTWNRLYRNNGDGTFTDQTVASGATAASVSGGNPRGMGNKFGAAWGDYDNDGDPDLFLTNVGPEILYRNNGDGTFTDVTAEAGVAGPDDSWESSSAAWFDYDNDGLVDIYLVNDYGRNRMMVNQGDGTFADETAARGLEDTGNGMGVTLGDFDNDGSFDIYLTNIYMGGEIQWNPLFANDGTGHFVDRSQDLEVENADWAWGTVFFDCDHDGDLDLYVANGFITRPAYHNRFFQNLLMETETVSFADISSASGTDGTGEARAAIAFDFDQDGDLDILVANARPGRDTGEPNTPYLYENVTATRNWLQVDLEGTESNRSGFGAVLRLTSSNGTVYRHNDGVGYLGQNDAPVHFGLGDAEVVDEIRVRWPNGRIESFMDIGVNQKIELVEGQGTVVASEPSGVPDAVSLALSAAYPNPFADTIEITVMAPEGESIEVEVGNILGQIVMQRHVAPETSQIRHVTLDFRDEARGVYTVRAVGADGVSKTLLIAKTR